MSLPLRRQSHQKASGESDSMAILSLSGYNLKKHFRIYLIFQRGSVLDSFGPY